MIKRILVALDPDPDTPVALDYAARLAKRHDAEVAGLAIVDTKRITTDVGGGGIGTMYYAEQRRAELSDEVRAKGRELLDTFVDRMEAAGVEHVERIEEGVPIKRMVEDTRYQDLLVVGREPHFYYAHPDRETTTLSDIVKKSVCPALIVCGAPRDVSEVLIAYDGSSASAATLQRFAQFQPFGTDLTVDLAHVRAGRIESREHSELLLRQAATYLKSHGYESISENSLSEGDPGERILEHAENSGTDLLAAGTHSVSAIQRLAFGSTTQHLIDQCVAPLFTFH
jgi:nucleotide-binding universal stress UspA family protein